MKRFAIVVALWSLSMTPVLALEIDAMTPEERDIFRQEVRAYLLESPEVLMEAIAVLEQRQAAAESITDVDMISANADALFADEFSYAGGNPDGDVIMVEFLDYRCPFCRRIHPEVAELVRTDGNIKYIIKEFPILGEESDLASRFAISVLQNSNPETYREVSNTLMNVRGSITFSSLDRLATQFGLDAEKIMGDMDSPQITAVIAENRALAQRMQINGTPGFIVGDQMVRGYVPPADMLQVVADARLASQ